MEMGNGFAFVARQQHIVTETEDYFIDLVFYNIELKCYIYTRVSTSVQVDGYSLDAQKDKLRKYAEYQEMSIVGEYSDEGKSGKSVEGRPQFKQMLSDIENDKDDVDYVLVFKLSRFGRNAADVLSSLQKMKSRLSELYMTSLSIQRWEWLR